MKRQTTNTSKTTEAIDQIFNYKYFEHFTESSNFYFIFGINCYNKNINEMLMGNYKIYFCDY